MSTRGWFLIAVSTLAILAGFGVGRWWYGNRLIDARRERANLLAAADTLREVAGGWERRAFIAESEKVLAEKASEELREHLDDQDRRLRSLTTAVIRLSDSQDVDTVAESRGDSTSIRWTHADSTVDLAVALAFAGMIRPDPNPAVRGTVDVGVTLRPEIAVSCDEDRGEPFTNIRLGDDRVTVTDLVTTVDEDVACLAAKRPSLGSLIPQPTIGTGIAIGAGVVAGFMLAR
jgi:hypothetical protein